MPSTLQFRRNQLLSKLFCTAIGLCVAGLFLAVPVQGGVFAASLGAASVKLDSDVFSR